MTVKPGTLRDPRSLSDAEKADIEVRIQRMHAQECVPRVLEQIRKQIGARPLPLPVILNDRLWVSTGIWGYDKKQISIEGDNHLLFTLTMLWKTLEYELPSTNPLVTPGIPQGFGSQFQLPCEFKIKTDLTESPSQGGWSTGFASGVKPELHSLVIVLVEAELQKLENVRPLY